ncbi:MAG: hypothetical protein JNL67_08935 [Planctomycetaceae bacterium]|nr:hypothetical protein [Planctomycetaceae bacterium]
MIIPRYWAESTVQKRTGNQQMTIRRFGWSDVSQMEAQRHADQRASEALAASAINSSVPRREPKRAYNGADGVPIREEVVEQRGSSIVTRNAYGSLCLNTPDVLFADIDLEFNPPVALSISTAIATAVAALFLLWGHAHWGIVVLSAAGFFLLALALVEFAYRKVVDFGGGLERRALRRVRNFLNNNRDWKVRVYRTPAGLRLLAVHRRFSPHEPIVAEFFKAVAADPVYVRMCLKQNCFRARVSPKPWRIGIPERIKPYRRVWPYTEEEMQAREKWVAAYERLAQSFASCQFVESLGMGHTDVAARSVQEHHDHLCQANVSLPLA